MTIEDTAPATLGDIGFREEQVTDNHQIKSCPNPIKQERLPMKTTRVWKVLSILVFVISIMSIAVLTFRYVRSPSLTVYGFTGGSGQLWLTLVAISSLEAFLILLSEQRLGNNRECS